MTQQKQAGSLQIPLWLVWIVALCFVLVGLGSFGILDNNEGLYAEIPREMLASHDWRQWVIPHMNGLPYMEKPPLLYWLTALSFAVFGMSEWSARLVPALSALACVALLIWFGDAVKRVQAGRLAALIFVSGTGVTAMAHVLMFDMLLTALLTAALMCAYRFLREERAVFLRWAAACLALALLAKGLVALILFGIVMATYLISSERSVRQGWRTVRRFFDLKAMLIFLALAAPWHVAASLTEPIFAWFYFINEHVLRFLGKREPHDYYAGAWWYYLPRMAIYLFPWSLFLVCLLLPGRLPAEAGAEALRFRKFLWMAWLAPLLFFSISSAKANYYLVVVMPFAAMHLALLIGRCGASGEVTPSPTSVGEGRDEGKFLDASSQVASQLHCPHPDPLPLMRERERNQGRNWVGAAPALLIALIALGACVALSLRADDSAQGLTILGFAQQQFLFGVFGGMALLAVGCAYIVWRGAMIGILMYLALPAWMVAALFAVLVAMEPTISKRPLAHYLQTALPGNVVYLYRDYEQQSSLPFYLKKTVGVIDSRSNDLFWGIKLRVNDIAISAEQFAQRLPNQTVAVVVAQRHLDDFRRAGFFKQFKGEKHIGDITVFYN